MKKFTLQNIKNFLQKFVSSKIFIALFFTLLGIFGTVLAKAKDQKEPITLADSDFDWNIVQEHNKIFENDPFFHANGIFAEMAEMEKRMNEAFSNHHKNMQKIFYEANSSNKISGKISNKTSVAKKEDDKNYYYELNFAGFKKEDIAVKIENNSLTFSAKNEVTKDSKENDSRLQSSFYYSFSLPKYDEKIEPEITKEDNKIIVKLKK